MKKNIFYILELTYLLNRYNIIDWQLDERGFIKSQLTREFSVRFRFHENRTGQNVIEFEGHYSYKTFKNVIESKTFYHYFRQNEQFEFQLLEMDVFFKNIQSKIGVQMPNNEKCIPRELNMIFYKNHVELSELPDLIEIKPFDGTLYADILKMQVIPNIK
jgi:hypothetical protein